MAAPVAAVLATLLTAAELAPGASYAPSVPTPEEVIGHALGAEISSPEQVERYVRALAAAAPERARLIRYAESWEGRPLHLLAIGSPERLARLDAVKADLRRLADPRGLPPAEAERLVSELPVVVWLVHAVHGDEASSSDAALAEAYHLLAARGDASVDLVLREAIVLIDPLQNPDGRARFVTHSQFSRGAPPDPEPVAAEHDEPWPTGRGNHYLFDLNRDWFIQSQPETAGRVRVALEWRPHVAVDLHEMGGESTYYFAPPARPGNPHLAATQHSWLEIFGRANAASFDERGWPYFVREVFDAFYPGYGDSWPAFHGAIGMTFEQASARGVVFRRRDEALLTYADGVRRHFTAALSTTVTAARNREALLRDYLEFSRSAVEQGSRGTPREYALLPGADPARAARLARTLAAQGIEVERLARPLRLRTAFLPAGTFVVPLAQPAGRLVRNLLDVDVALDPEFVEEQERRRRKRLPDAIYDVTAWSLPLAFDVETVAIAQSTPRTPGLDAPLAVVAPARVAYLVPWGTATVAALAEALPAGLRARVTSGAFTLGGRSFAAGTVVVRAAENGEGLRERLQGLVAHHGIEVVPADSGWVEEGVSLGSNDVEPLRAPRVLLAWDDPSSSASAGWARWVLERRYGLAVTVARVRSLAEVPLTRYDVVVLPAGDYREAIGRPVLERLRSWMRAGGTLVTLGEASRWAARKAVGLLHTSTEMRGGAPEDEEAEAEEAAELMGMPGRRSPAEGRAFDYETAIQPERELPDALPGAFLRVELDLEHWLSAGTDGVVQAVVEGQRVFTPIKLDRGRNVGVYAAKENLVASGLAWESSREARARKAFLIHQPVGQGHLVAFAEDPNFRGYTEATQLIFMNAVLLGPAY